MPIAYAKSERYDPPDLKVMGKKALQVKKATMRTIRNTRLSTEERRLLLSVVKYEGSPHHKRSPGNFGLTPPSAPRIDKTLCDEAGVFERSVAELLLKKAIEHGLVSEATTSDGFPKQLWAVNESGQVFEAMYGGSMRGRYHGYPVRRTNPLFSEITKRWAQG